MIQIQQLKLPVTAGEKELKAEICRKLKLPETELIRYRILKKSLDARKKDAIFYSYVIGAEVREEQKCLRHLPKEGFSLYDKKPYQVRITGTKPIPGRPIIVGAGPAGLFCAYELAKMGFCPLVIERGKTVREREKDVEHFHETMELNPESNVSFGEGGAGTFSDGKLNTMIKDRDQMGAYLLRTFVECGAPEEITYLNKPHIGTDILKEVIQNLRRKIEAMGGEFQFQTKLTDLVTKDGRLTGIMVNETTFLPCELLVLAIGHSARDTITMLYEKKLSMEPKAYAVGVRVQHRREWVNETQYGAFAKQLPTADYKLTHTCKNDRGVYSFCMCPGGYVVNASSEAGRLAINGMSNHDRMADNSNSAIVVTVTPEDYREADGTLTPLSGMHYQRRLEEAAYHAGKGKIPTQRYADFRENRASTACGSISPCTKGAVCYTNLRECLPDYLTESILEGMEAFDRQMKGFANPDCLLSAIESRTSSPVRILREEDGMSSVKGVFPCGEGAGYAGGITSAAMDGMKVAARIMSIYCLDKEN